MRRIRVKGGVLVGAVVSGALAAGTLTGAPTANATCASFFGIGNSANCTSTLFSAAIAIGTGATATANGLFGGAFAIGTNAYAQTYNAFDFATAVGTTSNALAGGNFGIAVQVGKGNAYAVPAGGLLGGGLGANIALSVTPGNTGDVATFAVGCGNIAVNLFGNASSVQGSYVSAAYLFNIAVNVLGGETSVGRSWRGCPVPTPPNSPNPNNAMTSTRYVSKARALKTRLDGPFPRRPVK